VFALIARARRVAERAIDWAAIAVFTGIFACMFVQVILRYAFDSPLTWSEELARYLMIWCAFLGWVIASRHDSHLAMTYVLDKAPRRTRAAVRITIEAATLLFAWVLGQRGLQLAVGSWDIENVAVPFNLGVVYLIEPIAATAIALYAAGNLVAALRELLVAAPASDPPVQESSP
jgi:TRAP-type C4-dicarboxylate transport system permease small subunit